MIESALSDRELLRVAGKSGDPNLVRYGHAIIDRSWAPEDDDDPSFREFCAAMCAAAHTFLDEGLDAGWDFSLQRRKTTGRRKWVVRYKGVIRKGADPQALALEVARVIQARADDD